MPSREYDDLLRRAQNGEFSLPAEAAPPTEDQPETDPNAGFFNHGVGDVLAAPFRGVEGAIQSTYDLVDTLAFDALPDYKQADRVLGTSHTLVGGLLEGVSQFATGFAVAGGAVGALGRGVKAAKFLVDAEKGLSLAGNLARGAITDFTVFDGHSGRLADLVAKIPGLEEPMNEYLNFALTSEQDSQIVGRLKNTIEGAGIGAAFDGLLKGFQWMREYRKRIALGEPIDTATKAADKIVPPKEVSTAMAKLDDLVFADDTPFEGPKIDEAVTKSADGEVRILADGTHAPDSPDIWHGSPHDIQGGFSSEFIGTGEGAQAYGFGHYVTESPGIAKHYSEMAQGRNDPIPDNQLETFFKPGRLVSSYDGVDRVVKFERDPKLGWSVVVRKVKLKDGKVVSEGPPRIHYTHPDTAELEYSSALPGNEDLINLIPSGRVYKGKLLPEQDEFLLWDKPLSEQSPMVQEALKGITPESLGLRYKVDGSGVGVFYKPDGSPHQAYGGGLATGSSLWRSSATGAQISNLLQEYLGTQKAVSEKLVSVGIKGNKYLAGDGSRKAGEGTYNYVVFEGSDVKLTQKNNQPFISLSSKHFPALTYTPAEVKNWVNLHGTLLSNPQTVISLHNGEVSIGLALRPDQLENARVKKLLASQTDDMTPGELGRMADEITSSTPPPKPPPTEGAGGGSQIPPSTAAGAGPAGEQGPSGQGMPPNPDSPTAAGGNSAQNGNQQPPAGAIPGAQQERATRINPEGATDHVTLLGKIGLTPEQAQDVGRYVGGKFEEGIALRGEILYKFNKAGDLVLESGEKMASPVLPITDAINPRDFSYVERLALGIERNSLNLDPIKDGGIASAIRAVEQMSRPMWEQDYARLGGETIKQMKARALGHFAELNGLPITDLEASIIRGGQEGAAHIDKAAEHAYAVSMLAGGIVKTVREDIGRLVKFEEGGAKAADWEWANVAEHLSLLQDCVGAMTIIKNSLGRGLYFMRTPVEAKFARRLTSAELRESPEKVADTLIKAGGRDAVLDMARKLSAIGTKTDLHSIAAALKASEATMGQKILRMTQEAWLGALLSSMRTHTTNMISNMFTVAFLPLERATAAGVGQYLVKDPAEAARLKGAFATAIGEYTSMFTSLGESFRAAKMAFKGTDNVLRPSSVVQDVLGRSDRRAIHAGQFGLEGDAAKAVDAFGAMASLPLKALRGSDEFFKNLAYRGRARSELIQRGVAEGKTGAALAEYVEKKMDTLIYKGQALSVDQARRRAIDQAQQEGLTGFHATAREEELVGQFTSSQEFKELSPLSKIALEQSEEATFTTPLREGSMSLGMQQFIQRHPLLKFAVPFVKTPVNILLFGTQRMDFISFGRWAFQTKLLGREGSAFANSRMRLLRDFASSDVTVRSQAAGRIMMGSALTAGIGAAVGAKMLSGRGPSDPDERRMLQEAGWLPYAIRLNDGTYVSYNRMDPLATIVGTVADMMESMDSSSDDRHADWREIGLGLIVAVANNATNKSYLQGIGNLVELLHQPDKSKGVVQNFFASFVPNAARDVANLAESVQGEDETVKEIRSVADAIMNKIPGVSHTLEPRRNALGEPIKRITAAGHDTVGPLADLLVPYSSRKGQDAILDELAGLDYGFSNPNSQRNGYDMLDVRSASGQTSYDRWLENSGHIELGGGTLRESLKELLSNPMYQQLSKLSDNGEISPRAAQVRLLIDRYRRAALQKTMSEIPELNVLERNALLQRAANHAGVSLSNL